MVRQAGNLIVSIPKLLLPTKRTCSGQLELLVESAVPWQPPAIEAFDKAMRLLTQAASRGAFPGSGIKPASSQFAAQPARLVELRLLAYEIEGTAFDTYAFELLRGMAERLVLQGVHVRGMQLSCLSESSDLYVKPEPNDRSEYDAYPIRCHNLGFAVERESLVESRSRRCLVELTTPVTKQHVDQLRICVSPWFSLLEDGAYAFPIGLPSEVFSVAGSVAIFDELSIEVSIDRFSASECAWDTLLNVLHACWSDTGAVSHVLIE